MKYIILVLFISINFELLAEACNAKWFSNVINIKIDENYTPKPLNLMIQANKHCSGLVFQSDNYQARKLINGINEIPFEIYNDISLQNVFPLRSTSNVFSPITEKQFNLFIDTQIKNLTIIPQAGEYKHKEYINLYDKNHRFLDRIEVNVTLTVSEQISLKLVKPETSTSIGSALAFKRIDKGEQVNLDILVNSNVGYSLWIESENEGNLLHESINENIQYKTFVNDQNIGFIQNSQLEIHQMNQSAINDRINLKFEIDQNVDQKPAGEYLDVVRINIQSEL